MKIAVMTDSTAYITKDVRDEYGIHMVPLSVVFDKDVYREEIDITASAFYQKVGDSSELPKTSQPSIGVITNKLEELCTEYDAVISIHLSSGISGTCQAVHSAGQMIEGIDVYAYDSELSCMAQGFYALEAAKMASNGHTPQEIITRLDEMKQTMRAYFMVDDLQNLKRGGRLNGAQAFVGGLLKVKPILHFVDKIIVPFEKIRTRKKALGRILGMLEDDTQKGNDIRLVVIHGNREQMARDLQQEITEKYTNVTCTISYFGPVIGTHLGEGAIGCAWYVM